MSWAGLPNRLSPGRDGEHPIGSCLLVVGCALLLLSCASMPATPAPANMAVVDVPKPDPDHEIAAATRASPTAAYIPDAEIIKVAIGRSPDDADTYIMRAAFDVGTVTGPTIITPNGGATRSNRTI